MSADAKSGKRRTPLVKWLLILVPLWFCVSVGGALWYYFHREKLEARAEETRFAKTVEIPGLADDLRKIVGVIGERNASSEEAAANLTRMASMIEGALGPGNVGYKVEKFHGPERWPLIEATVHGRDAAAPPVWVLTSYDSPAGSPGAESNATGIAATLAAAQALAGDKTVADIHFVFLPHANDPESPVLETLTRFAARVNPEAPGAILCVEAMGGGELLWLTSREVSAAPLGKVQGLGKVVGAEVVCLGDDTDLASMLFEMNLPAVRVSTRARLAADEHDDRLPFAPTVAASAGRLAELIRRCAGMAK
jgi:hypothetical protein